MAINANKEIQKLRDAEDRLSDKITAFAGNMKFVYLHTAWFTLWILINVGLFGSALVFDDFPFGLLTLIVSLEAIFLSTFVMISQNRQGQAAELRARRRCDRCFQHGANSVNTGVARATHTLDNVVAIGAGSTNVNKDIQLNVQANNTGGAILSMAYAQEAAITLLGSNSQFPSGANLPITTAVVYGAGNTGINAISAMLETSITPSTGTQQGTYNYHQLDKTTFANPVNVAGEVTATNTPSTDIYNGNAIATGEEILPRLSVNSAQPLNASGTLHLIYFTARKTETINNIRMSTDATAATGTTLARVGIYSVAAGTGNLTLLAACANDTTLFGGTYTPYSRALTAAFNKVKGTRYAVGVLVVSAGMPAITATTCAGADAAIAPRLCGIVTGQADLPANITAGTVAEDYRLFQCMITP